jgi:hypothetical protein
MPKFEITIRPGLEKLIDYENSEQLFAGLVISLLEQLGFDTGSATARELVAGVLASCMTTGNAQIVTLATVEEKPARLLFCMLCDEEEGMRAAQLAHILERQSTGGKMS